MVCRLSLAYTGLCISELILKIVSHHRCDQIILHAAAADYIMPDNDNFAQQRGQNGPIAELSIPVCTQLFLAEYSSWQNFITSNPVGEPELVNAVHSGPAEIPSTVKSRTVNPFPQKHLF